MFPPFTSMLLVQFCSLEIMGHYFLSPGLLSCPLAPFLFILFGEALSSYLRSSTVGIKGIVLPITQSTVVDVEFAYDTTLYFDGEIGNLGRVQNALQVFSDATCASRNWNKSVGL